MRWVLRYIILILIFTSFRTAYDMPEVGESAPDFTISSISGDSLMFSTYKGGYVFLDFWASWCSPCRKNHQALAEVYDSLKDKLIRDSIKFTIISISLDEDSLSWANGIKHSNLFWPDHGCDFMKWKSPVVKSYGLSYLPYNFLIDPDGIIIAKGMSVEEIKSTCFHLFKD